MNLTFTLTPDEIARRHQQRPRRFLGHPVIDSVGNAMLIAFSVVLLAGTLSVAPRVAVLLGVLVAGVSLYNSYRSTVHFPRYRISVGRANDPMAVAVTPEGISTTRGVKKTTQRWTALHQFRVVDGGITLEFLDTTVRWVPDRAFASATERDAFLALVLSHAPATITQKARTAGDNRPVVTLASGTWRWSIEGTESPRATLVLEDPADERNNIIAEIDDEWVDWTAERLDAAIGVPKRRDVVDHDNITWRIAFTANDVAEAKPVNYPESLPKPASRMWFRPSEGENSTVQSLPWSGLGHVTTEDLREWLTSLSRHR
jgi:hypothetical protein